METRATTTTDDGLIGLAADGDARAIRALYDRFSPRVYAVVRRIAGDDDLAQDWAQEAWIRAIRALPTFRGEARFSTWLHRIAVNAALQALRKAETRRRRETPLPAEPGEAHPSIEARPGDVLLRERIAWALDRIPARMREVLILHDVEGYTHEDIGEVLGIAPGTSKSQLFKARAKMRDLLGSLEAEESTRPDRGVETCSI